MKKVIIVGAGASGLMAAIAAADEGALVTVLEGMEKPGKKILATGNGRCNLTNLEHERLDRYRGASMDFITSVMEKLPVAKTLDFFENIGLLLQNKGGYIYPYVNQASAVQEVLLTEARRLGVKIKCCEKVMKLESGKGMPAWKVHTASWVYEGDAVILAAGSKAAPQTGSDGSGYDLAKQMGHRILPPREALVPLKLQEKWVRKASGVRMPVRAMLSVGDGKNKKTYTEVGELQWTDYGISGIVIFQLSRYAVCALAEKKSVYMTLDLLPDFSEEALLERLKKKQLFGVTDELLTGILPKKMIPVICELSGLKPSLKAAALTEQQLQELLHQIKHLRVSVIGHKSFDAAQVCSGGVDTEQVNPATLESKHKKGLYFAGELLDVDGICGGYNLQWAWSSGYTAGKAAAQEKQ